MFVQSIPFILGAPGPIEYVGGKTQVIAGSTGTNTAVSLTGLTGGLASAPAPGDFVIIGYGVSDNNADVNIQAISSGWTEQADMHSPTNTFDSQCGVYTKRMGAIPDTSVTVGPTGSSADNGKVAVSVWRNVNAATPLDVAIVTGGSSGSGGTSNPDPGAITPVTNGAMIVIVGHTGNTGGFTTLGDLTNTLREGSSKGTLGIGAKAWDGLGAYDCVRWTGGSVVSDTGNTWCVMALRPA